MRSTFEKMLLASGLIEASEAATNASIQGFAEIENATLPVTESLVRTYVARTTTMRSRSDEESQRLADSLDEFSKNLAKHVGKTARWLVIGHKNDWHFLCCRLAPEGPLIGCMRVRRDGPSPA